MPRYAPVSERSAQGRAQGGAANQPCPIPNVPKPGVHEIPCRKSQYKFNVLVKLVNMIYFELFILPHTFIYMQSVSPQHLGGMKIETHWVHVETEDVASAEGSERGLTKSIRRGCALANRSTTAWGSRGTDRWMNSKRRAFRRD